MMGQSEVVSKAGTPASPPPLATAYRPSRVAWSLLVGYDLFISYRRSDASKYASELFSSLKQANFLCFLDDNDATPGRPLTDRLRQALRRSLVLVVIASPELKDSPWVPQEVAIFAETGRDVIWIDVDGGREAAAKSGAFKSILAKEDRLWIEELPAVHAADPPSAHVIGSIQKNFRHRRANQNLALIAVSAIVALAAIGLLATVQWQSALFQLQVVRSQALAAESRRLAEKEPFLAAQKAVEAYQASPSLDAQTALVESLSRAPQLKKLLPCEPGHHAVGAAFSPGATPRLVYACIAVSSSQ